MGMCLGLVTRFDPDDMLEKGIYPSIWAREEDDTLEYLMHHLQALRRFLRDAVNEEVGVVVYLC